MRDMTLGRRDFIRLGILTGIFTMSGCSFSSGRGVLGLPKGILPREFLQALPSRWKYQFLEVKSEKDFYKSALEKRIDLMVIGDGWLNDCPYEEFQSIEADENFPQLNSKAKFFLSSMNSAISSRLLPIAVSPWVLIFRGEEDLWLQARESWQVLLEPKLKGHVILPSSPRVIMSLADHMKGSNSLERLRSQAKSFDDKNGLNWLLAGQAKVAVLPLQVCLRALASDPRLRIAFPKEGSALNWSVLLRPKKSLEALPLNWIQEARSLPLLVKLLAKGVIPPIAYPQIVEVSDLLPEKYRSIYQSEGAFENSWSFKPLSNLERKGLESRWLSSAP